MADDRAPVYEEDGVWVIRASAGGFCMKALSAHGQGLSPADHPDFLLDKFAEGVAAEPAIEKMLEDKGIRVNNQQELVELPVGSKIKFRGHIDGTGLEEAAGTGELFIVEYKALGKSMYSKLEKHGINSIYYYAVQLSIYMAAKKMRGMLVVGIKDDDGIVVDIETYMFDEPPIPIGKIKARAMKIVKYIEEGALPSCDYAQYPCQFHFLHDGEEVWAKGDTVEIHDEELDRLIEELFEIRAAESQLKGQKERVTEGIKKIVDREGGKGKRVETEEWVFNDVVQDVKGNWDEDKIKDVYPHPDELRKDNYERRFITIQTRKTKDEDGDSGETSDGDS